MKDTQLTYLGIGMYISVGYYLDNNPLCTEMSIAPRSADLPPLPAHRDIIKNNSF